MISAFKKGNTETAQNFWMVRTRKISLAERSKSREDVPFLQCEKATDVVTSAAFFIESYCSPSGNTSSLSVSESPFILGNVLEDFDISRILGEDVFEEGNGFRKLTIVLQMLRSSQLFRAIRL